MSEIEEIHHDNLAEAEALILLAIEEKKNNLNLSLRGLATRYSISRTTLHARWNGRQSKAVSSQNRQLLTPNEEDSLKKWILYLNCVGVAPQHAEVRKMANQILAARGTKPPILIGNNWLTRYLKRTEELVSKLARPRDYIRAFCETPEKFEDWFNRVESTIEELGIDACDVYNVDETGFSMGILSATQVITGTNAREDPVIIQPGSREWVTVIECISAGGVALPPFVIFKGARLQKAWFDKLPPGWRLGVTENGWTSNDMALSWLKNIFIPSTANCTKGTHRLLLFDGHGSHLTEVFKEICEENFIKIQCMPPHTSHRLQPLDLVSFSVLKRAYRKELNARASLRIHSIDKIGFLELYPKARNTAFRAENTKSAFRVAGLYPPNRNYVLSKLPTSVFRSDPELEEVTQEDIRDDPQEDPTTPSKYDKLKDLEAQINTYIPQISKGPRTPLKMILKEVFKISHMSLQSAAVLSQELTKGLTSTLLLKKKKARPKRQFILESDLSVEEVEDIFAINPGAEECQNGELTEQASDGSPKRKRRQYSCGGCHNVGHTIKTCPEKNT